MKLPHWKRLRLELPRLRLPQFVLSTEAPRWARTLEAVGALIVVGTVTYLILDQSARVNVALGLIAATVVIWTLAFLVPGSRDKEQSWARSAQVAFLVMALGQASTVGINQRAQRAADARNFRADSLAELRALRADSSSEARIRRADSTQASRELLAKRAAEEIERFRRNAELAASERRCAALEHELEVRATLLRDSLSACGALEPAPARQEAGFYYRATVALESYLGPRMRFTDDIRSNTTMQLLTELNERKPSAESRMMMRYIYAATLNDAATRPQVVSNSWSVPDTMMVSMHEPYSSGAIKRPMSWLLPLIAPRHQRPR